MKFRDRVTGQIYNSVFEIQEKFPNVSFPIAWDTTTYDFANVDVIVETPQPQLTNLSNKIEYLGVQLIDGKWTEVWTEVPKYEDPVEQADWEAQCLQTQWNNIRVERDRLLTLTDYTQLPDTPITTINRTAFATYRQELRNITTQSDPYNITWPMSPIYEKE